MTQGLPKATFAFGFGLGLATSAVFWEVKFPKVAHISVMQLLQHEHEETLHHVHTVHLCALSLQSLLPPERGGITS